MSPLSLLFPNKRFGLRLRGVLTIQFLAMLLVALVGMGLATPSFSLTASPADDAASSAKKPIINSATSADFSTPFTPLEWRALTPAQQATLKPLADSWDQLSDEQKRKWFSLSANFPQMSTDEQIKLHTRMAQWAALSPHQRQQARLNFAEIQKITPVQKKEKWVAYQALSPEEKQQLAKTAPPKPPRTALASKPTPAGQLIKRLPPPKKAGSIAMPASAASLTDKKTLLTRPVPPKLPTPPTEPSASITNDPSKP